jgi:hypothetical protein
MGYNGCLVGFSIMAIIFDLGCIKRKIKMKNIITKSLMYILLIIRLILITIASVIGMGALALITIIVIFEPVSKWLLKQEKKLKRQIWQSQN